MSRRSNESQSEDWITDVRRPLAKRREKKPETKGGQIWALWPEIKAALADGQTIKSIRLWLDEEGDVVVTAGSLRSYIRRCRRKEGGRREAVAAAPAQPIISKRNPLHLPAFEAPLRSIPEKREPASVPDDPMAIAREALNKPRFDIRKVHNDGDPTGQNLI